MSKDWKILCRNYGKLESLRIPMISFLIIKDVRESM